MQFKDFKYERVKFEDIKAFYKEHLDNLKNTKNANEFMEEFKTINKYRAHYLTMSSISSIHHTIDTSDKFYDEENNYLDEVSPKIQEYETEFMNICLNTPFRKELNIPKTFFMLAENANKEFSKEIIEDLQEENRLVSEYGKLKASAKIDFDGKIYNLSSIAIKLSDSNRDIRKKAYSAINKFYSDNEDKFDDIFDSLVKVRDRIAKKLGYKNFTELGYIRMNRFDYDENMVKKYREEVLKVIVPLSNEIYKRQAKRLGLENLECFDIPYEFKTGNPKPIGDDKVLLKAAQKMYSEMSDVTKEFFNIMVDTNLFDLPTRPNKEMGGYCTELYDYKLPFIFSNFNGTAGDVNVLTHETGHALQGYLSMKEIDTPDVCFPTLETCEIHSMSMEFFAHPWLNLFFGKDEQKYIYHHITDSLTFLPYGVLVDHFQHEVYNNPNMSKEERKKCFAKLEKLYKPHISYEGFDLLEKGGWFYRQNHIFSSPFYYIDYTLAGVCALQFYTRVLNNDENAWNDYLNICKVGGTKSFLETVKLAGLKSPFIEGCLDEVAKTMRKKLSEINDLDF